MAKYFKENWTFIVPFLLFFTIGLYFNFFFEKGFLTLYCNDNQTEFLNIFFKFASKLAETIAIVSISLILLWKNFGKAFIFLSAFLVNTIIVQLLKKVVFNSPRPAQYFNDLVELNIIENVVIHYHHSFPSGHTAAAFCMFSLLALFFSNKLLKFCFCMLACLVAFSRIYLLQHFVADVLAGAILGIVMAHFTYYFLNTMTLMNFQKWKHQSLSKYLSK